MMIWARMSYELFTLKGLVSTALDPNNARVFSPMDEGMIGTQKSIGLQKKTQIKQMFVQL